MEIRKITETYSVGPQAEPTDMAALAEAGFVAVVNNRPDDEVPPELQSDRMQAAAEAAGITYVANPVVNGGLTMDMVAGQGKALKTADGPVFAWCRTGTRSSIVWALSQAGILPTDEILSRLSGAGYDIPGLGAQIEALAQG